jgi:hypothetical protein
MRAISSRVNRSPSVRPATAADGSVTVNADGRACDRRVNRRQ